MKMKSLRFWRRLVAFSFAFAFLSIDSGWAGIYSEPPRQADPAKKYLFYMHGAWIEKHGLGQSHPVHGRYEYDQIVRTLADQGFEVISEARLSEVPFRDYAEKVAGEVNQLLAGGVPPEQISVTGHSKGGHLALMVASFVQQPGVNYVVMASCGKQGSEFRLHYERYLRKSARQLAGRVLSIYDAADREASTCREAFRSARNAETDELVLRTGRGHGLFYAPDRAWLDPLLAWIQ